ncbi:MAG: ABC transporter ATP-binding protein/permease [Eubacteriaceae bacterium]|nr:ABC transporter ATP-binding protein/permease [Eubacteriaceae bacterium]
MKTILKYLSPYKLLIVVVVMFIGLQAYSSLAMPDYNRKIVNVGLQQQGLTGPAPPVIRAESLSELAVLLPKEQAEALQACYIPISPDDSKLLADYPNTASIPAYSIKSSQATQDANALIAQPIHLLWHLKGEGGPYGEVVAYAISAMSLDAIEVLASPDWAKKLADMPEGAKDSLLESVYYGIAQIPNSYLSQSAIRFATGEISTLGGNLRKIQNAYLLRAGRDMLFIAFLGAVGAIGASFMLSNLSARFGRDLRNDIFLKVMGYSNAEINEFSTASLITRSTNDVQQVQMMATMGLRHLIFSPLMAAGGVASVLRTNVSMAWIVLVGVIAVVAFMVGQFGKVMPRFSLVQRLMDRMNLLMREMLTGMPVIRAFGTEKKEEARFGAANTELFELRVGINRTMGLMFPAISLIMNGTGVLIVYRGALAVDAGQMQVGDIIAFISYSMMIISSFQMISMMSIQLPRAMISIGRLEEALLKNVSIASPEEGAKKPESSVVEFKDVSFKYADDSSGNVLSNINFTALPGQTTAIIGGTGSGKTSLANLIPRFYDVTEGSVLVGGHDVRELDLHALRELIGYVPQTSVLFSGTVESNIKFAGEGVGEEEAKQAAEIAQAEEFISVMPNGYSEPISQGGSNVSGGQRQRLAIARAVAKQPGIYIFDDSFSALDFKTDLALRRALTKSFSDATVIIITQRISTAMQSGQIIVLEDGCIIGKGTHDELMGSCELYTAIAKSQLSESFFEEGGE